MHLLGKSVAEVKISICSFSVVGKVGTLSELGRGGLINLGVMNGKWPFAYLIF